MHDHSSASFLDTKPHYALLDGLRGVAALLVLVYHVFEGYAFAAGEAVIEGMNHGYLAVDFFFILSGFVIAYAYDDRWAAQPAGQRPRLTLGSFFKRRIIRLHPLVVLGAFIGVACFYVQGGVTWQGEKVAGSLVMLALLAGMFMLPAVPGCSYEVRGNGEMYPLNGPCWSLFFEYIGNMLYALALRKLGNKSLAAVVAALGLLEASFALFDPSGYGFLGVGWTLDGINFVGGALRMLFPFSLGLLLARHFRPTKVRGAFWICSLVLLTLFLVPYLPGRFLLTGTDAAEGSFGLSVITNGIFEMFCIAVVFPALVWLAASGSTTDRFSTASCKFLGDLSFPLYIVHYPLMYVFYAWLIETEQYTWQETSLASTAVVLANIVLAYAALKWFDEPVRRWLARKFL